MLKFIPHKPEYWKKNRPKEINGQNINLQNWNDIIAIFERRKKAISFNMIIKVYEKKKERETYEKFLTYKKSKTPLQLLKEHSIFLTYLYDQEKKRQDNIDNKARQIITNVSLLFAFIAFSSAIILNKDNYVKAINESALVTVLIALTIAVIAVIIAIACLNMKDYSRPPLNIIFEKENQIEEDFFRARIFNFISSLYVNTKTNSRKTVRLKLSNWLIAISISLIGLFTILNIYSIKIRNIKQSVKIIQENSKK